MVSQVVFRNAAVVTDEQAYVMQAYTLSEGKVARPLPPASEFFRHEMMIMDDNAGWLSRYPPGHALWLIPGVLLGQPRIMVSLAAGLAVFILGNLGRLVQCSPYILPLLLLISPYFIFMNGTLLSHTSGLPAVALFLFFYIYWKEKGAAVFALFAGLAWSWLFLNRTYTGLLLALPFAFDALWDLAGKRDKGIFYSTCMFVGSAAIGIFLYLGYNFLAVGDPLLPTYLYYAPSENLGFGFRHTDVHPVVHAFSQGSISMWENVLLLDRWLFGFQGSLLLVLALAVVGWHRRWSFLCLFAVVSVLTGYIFFWFKGVRTVGPVYYFELLPFLFLAAGFGIQKTVQRFPPRGSFVSTVSYLVCVLGVITMSLNFMWKQGLQLRSAQTIIGQYQQIIATAPQNSLILVEPFPGMNSVDKGTSFNPRGVESDPLVVAAGQHHPGIILELFPDRVPYHLYRKGDRLLLEPYSNSDSIRYVYHITGMAASTGTNELAADGREIRVAREGKDKAGWLAFGDTRLLPPGNYTLSGEVEIRKAVEASPSRLEIVADQGREIVAAGKFDHSSPWRPFSVTFSLNRHTAIEVRIRYGGTGDVVFGDMVLTERVGK